MDKEIDKFVDLLFNFDIKNLENETKILEDYKKIQQENQELKEKIKTYEDPNDLTLMFMYCYEKAKDKIKELQEQNKKYKEVIDKAIEYIEKHLTDNGRFLMLNEWQVPDLLDILKEVE